jgi:hypothetical protein
VVATLLVTPGAVFVAANVLQYGLGFEGAARLARPLFALPAVAWIVTALVLAGPVMALLLAASRLLPIRPYGASPSPSRQTRMAGTGCTLAPRSGIEVAGGIHG